VKWDITGLYQSVFDLFYTLCLDLYLWSFTFVSYAMVLEILKIKDLKTLNRDYKKQPNEAVNAVQLNQLNVSFIWQDILFSWYLIT